MMSKFHKTSYSRGGVFAGVASSQGRRNPPPQQQEWGLRTEQPCDRRVDVESSLLLTHKSHQQHPVDPRKTINKSEVKLYQTNTGFNRERPQSKQEPRSKQAGENKLKTQVVLLPDRPQTSKGVRQCRGKVRQEQQESDNYEQFPIQVKITEKKGRMRSSHGKRDRQEGSLVTFDTSIDPEFLSLFAN